jgi:hypothetical protein
MLRADEYEMEIDQFYYLFKAFQEGIRADDMVSTSTQCSYLFWLMVREGNYTD